MYNPASSCSAFIHLLMKHPILVIAMGLVGASGLIMQQANNPEKTILVTEIENAETNLGVNTVAEAKARFDVIKNIGNGLNNMALKDVLGKVPACQNLSEEEVRDNPEMLEKVAFLYFLDLINKSGGDIEAATIAFQKAKDGIISVDEIIPLVSII